MQASARLFGKVTEAFDRIKVSWVVGFLLFSGAILRVVAGIYYTHLKPFHFESVHVALALATRGEYADAYGAGTGSTAHLGPLVPLIMAGLYYVFGPGQPLAVAMMILL